MNEVKVFNYAFIILNLFVAITLLRFGYPLFNNIIEAYLFYVPFILLYAFFGLAVLAKNLKPILDRKNKKGV